MKDLVALIQSLQEGGDAPAIISLSKKGSRTWSFQQLGKISRQLTMGFTKAGLAPQSHAILLAPNQPEWIAVVCGLIGAGIIPVPVDPQMGKEDLTHVLSDSEGKWVFTTSSALPLLQSHQLVHNRDVVLLDAGGKERKRFRINFASSFEVLPNGRVLVAHPPSDEVIEYDADGRPAHVRHRKMECR
jgi:long-chain acyl-CoA synthetase